MTPDYAELRDALTPEAVLVLGALVVLGVDLALARGRALLSRLRIAVTLGLAAVVAATFATCAVGVPGDLFGGILTLDTLTLVTRIGVLLLAALTLGLLTSGPLRHPAEYVAVILFATCGFTLMAAAQQLLIAFLAIELASLSLYVLAGFNKTRPESAEAALKYFLFGGVSAAFLLFGFSLVYGLTGSLDFVEIARHLRAMPPNMLLTVALVMMLAAFGFKAAAAPFHLWAPDVYQGAPAPSAALIASASKLAGFTLFGRMLWVGFASSAGTTAWAGQAPGWLSVIVIVSAVSLVLGNLAALAQSNVRRLLAYSAIAHAGAMLIGIVAGGSVGPAPLFYYASTYGLATVGAFGVIAVVARAGRCEDLTDLAGLSRRSPLLAGCLLVFILSLAGIPPLAGFFGKFIVFAYALKLHGLAGSAGWLALLAIAMSAVGLYYYLLILKQAMVARPAPNAADRIDVPLGAAAALALAATLIVALGVFPSVVLRMIQ